MAKSRILVVEDEAIVAEDIKSTLKILGYDIPAVVYSGEDAIEKAKEIRPDLVLMDIVLKGKIDGIEAAEQIRAQFDIPVVFLTAYSDEKTLQRAKITTPFGYIIKPFEERELYTNIEIALYKHKIEKKLKESEKLLSTTLKSIGDAIIATDNKGFITFMNIVAENLTGWKQEDALGIHLEDVFNIINEETGDTIEPPLLRILQEGVILGLANHTVLISKDGNRIPVDDSGAPIRDDNGKIMGAVLVFRDVSERKRMEKALKESEELYRMLVKTSPDAVTVSDLNGVIIEVSKRSLELHGFESPEELIGKDYLLLVAPEDIEKSKAALRKIMDEGRISSIELTMLRKDKTRFIGEVNGTLIKDSYGKPAAFMGVMRDITARKQAEEAINKGILEMRALNNLSQKVSSSLSLDLVVRYAIEEIISGTSADLALIYLREGEDLILKGVLPDNPEFRDQRTIITRVGDCLCGLAVSKGKPFYSENIHTDKLCTREECKKSGINSFAALPLTAEDKVIGVLGLASVKERDFNRDAAFLEISAREVAVSLQNAILHEKLKYHADKLEKSIEDVKRAKDALRESEERFRQFFENEPEYCYMVSEEGIIQDINKSALKALGYKKEEIVGKPREMIYAPESRESVKVNFDDWKKTGKISENETVIITKNGIRRTVILNADSVRDNSGKILYCISVQKDITERKQAERELIKANRALRMLSECNQIIVKANEEPEMLRSVCKTIVDIGGYRLAWVGFAEHDEAKTVKPAAYAGYSAEYIEKINITWSDTKQGCGPTGTAIKTGKPHICRNILTDPNYELWRSEAKKHGYVSSVAIPLVSLSDNITFGSLIIYSVEPDAFDSEELNLLMELSYDLSYAVRTLRTRAERNIAEKALFESEEKFRLIFENANDVIVYADKFGNLIEVNKKAEDILGYKREDVVNRNFIELGLFKLGDLPKILKLFKDSVSRGGVIETEGKGFNILGLEIKRKSGDIAFLEASTAIIKKNGRLEGFLSILRDITERKHAEEALKEVNTRLKYLLTSTSAAIYTSKVSGDYGATSITENIKQMSGYEPQEFINDPSFWVNHIHPEDKKRVLSEVRRLFDQRKHTYEYRFLKKDGAYMWIRNDVNLITDEDGNPVEIVGYWIDITERRHAEEALRESEEKFRNLAEQSPNMIFINTKGRVVYANKRCEEVMGYKREEFYAQDFNFLTLISPEDMGMVKERFSRHTKGEDVSPYDYSLITKDGRRIESIISTKLIYYEGDHAILGTVTDITERKRAEEALRESEEKFRNLAEQSPNMIFISRKDRLVYTNKRCEEVLGHKREEFYAPDFNFNALTFPENAKKIIENFSRMMKGEEVEPYEFTIIGKKGNTVYAFLTARMIKYEGENSILGIITDITELKKAEEELKKTAEELKRANAELETFVYSIAHDLRTPLRSMQGFSEALLEDYAKQMDPTAQDYARRIVASVNRMDTTIQDLLSYSRVTLAETVMKPINMESILKDVLEQFKPKIQESGAQITIKKPLNDVTGNQTSLINIVGNLLSNALKFVAPGVKPEVNIRTEEHDSMVRLWVEDNGIGIAPEYHERIFKVFERLHRPEEYPGTGIGLAIVRKGVEKMGGKIGVESELGRGSKFWVDLPKSKEKK